MRVLYIVYVINVIYCNFDKYITRIKSSETRTIPAQPAQPASGVQCIRCAARTGWAARHPRAVRSFGRAAQTARLTPNRRGAISQANHSRATRATMTRPRPRRVYNIYNGLASHAPAHFDYANGERRRVIVIITRCRTPSVERRHHQKCRQHSRARVRFVCLSQIRH